MSIQSPRRPHRIVGALLALLTTAGCFASGRIRYRDNPELSSVKLATGRASDVPVAHLGVVEATASGLDSCDDVAAAALRDLLREAQAVGGTGVAEVKFRARWHWTGRVLCKRGLGGLTATVRGVATP